MTRTVGNDVHHEVELQALERGTPHERRLVQPLHEAEVVGWRGGLLLVDLRVQLELCGEVALNVLDVSRVGRKEGTYPEYTVG